MAISLEPQAREIVGDFGATLPRIRALLDTDVLAACRGDPAAWTRCRSATPA